MKYNKNCIKAKSIDTERLFKENSQKYRNNFQKDRDRILYSNSFRRLSGKTQVFLTGQNDHLRTRLTHSLEVNQIAKTISSALNLNLDLTEAIALGHDIGHTPFGHVGERTLNFIMNGCDAVKDFNYELPDNLKGFKHNVQALRILTDLEASKEMYNGLNICNYTLWGIVNHTKYKNISCKRTKFNRSDETESICYFDHKTKKCLQNGELRLDFYNNYFEQFENSKSWTFEGLVVRLADEIAQRHHDIEDALHAGLLDKATIVDLIDENFRDFMDPNIKKSFENLKNQSNPHLINCYVSRFIVNFLILQAIMDSHKNIFNLCSNYNINKAKEYTANKSNIFNNENIFTFVAYNTDFEKAETNFMEFLKNKILNSYIAQKMDGKAEFIIRKLFNAFVSNPQQLPDKTLLYFFNTFLGNTYVNTAKIKYSDKNLIGGLRGELKSNFDRNDSPDYKHALLRTICDYISGMTDNYAYNQYEILYGSTRMFY